jgi:hypothetical protein
MTEVAVDSGSAAFQELRLSPDQASAALAAKATAFQAAERLNLATATALSAKAAPVAAPASADSNASRARLAQLSADPKWRDAFFRGDVEARRTFSELTASIASGSVVSDVLAGADASGAEYTLVASNQLSPRATGLEIAHLRELGLNDATIKQAFDGGTITPAEREAAKVSKQLRLDDADWSARYLRGCWAEKREMAHLNLIISGASA